MAEQDDTPFLSRWARRKQEAQRQDHKDHKNHKDQPAASAEQAMPAQTPGTDAGAAGVGPPDTAPIEAAFDPATLPKIDDLTPESDIAAFLREGVPAEIKRLALRRMWSLDPQIRDFIEVAENQYDWNAVDGVPGFGALPAAASLVDA